MAILNIEPPPSVKAPNYDGWMSRFWNALRTNNPTNIDLGSDVSGTLPVTNGGTGATTAANARTALDVPKRDGTNASGTWGISVSGNAATASAVDWSGVADKPFLTKGIYNGTATRTQSGAVTDATLVPASGVGSVTLPAGFFSSVGKQLHVRLCGLYTTDASPGNATLTLKFGSTTYTTTGSFALDSSCTNKIWWWEGYITCRSTGASGTVSGNFAWIHSENNTQGTMHSQDAAVTSPVTIDTTAAQTLDVQLTTTDAGTSFSCTCCTLWENF